GIYAGAILGDNSGSRQCCNASFTDGDNFGPNCLNVRAGFGHNFTTTGDGDLHARFSDQCLTWFDGKVRVLLALGNRRSLTPEDGIDQSLLWIYINSLVHYRFLWFGYRLGFVSSGFRLLARGGYRTCGHFAVPVRRVCNAVAVLC